MGHDSGFVMMWPHYQQMLVTECPLLVPCDGLTPDISVDNMDSVDISLPL